MQGVSAYLGLVDAALLYEDEGALQAAAELAHREVLRGGHGAADLAHQDDAPPACGNGPLLIDIAPIWGIWSLSFEVLALVPSLLHEHRGEIPLSWTS